MSLDEFKSAWAAELGDLSAARIATLWKKSKTMTEKDISAAISASRAAAAKDQARRGKSAHIDSQAGVTQSEDRSAHSHVPEDASPAVMPAVLTKFATSSTVDPTTTSPSLTMSTAPDVASEVAAASSSVVESETVSAAEPEVDPVNTEVDRRWSRICAPMGIDQIILTKAIKKLHRWIMTKDIADSDRAARVNELYECVDRLLVLRHKYGEAVDVLKALGQK